MPSPRSYLRTIPCWDHQRHLLARLDVAIADALGALVQPGQTVLDFGCGDRPYESVVRGLQANYIGCDLAGTPDLLVQPGSPVPRDSASLDGILSSQVLEHVGDLDWYLGECRRLLKPGGWLLLSTHGMWLYHPHPTDFRRWTRDGLKLELESRGFAVESFQPLVGPLAYSTQIRLLGFHHLLTKVPIIGRLLLTPLACLMNARMALEDAITPEAIRADNATVYVLICRVGPARNERRPTSN